MKIGIDISSLVFDRGVSRYTSNLVRALAQDPTHELFLYGTSLRQEAKLKKQVVFLTKGAQSKISHKIQKLPPKLLTKFWDFGLNPIQKIFPNLDVFHSWDWIQPPDKNLPLVSTIHDLAILKFPQTAHPEILKRHQKSWDILKKRHAQIIAVSQSTKKDIVSLLQIPSERVTVIHEALPQETLAVANELSPDQYEIIKSRLKLNRPYLLFVGTREPRKNLLKLIEAWQSFAKTHDLLIAGEEGWDETDQVRKMFKHQPHFLGKVSDQELVVLYSEAACFVYPSIYEGFGLPILEAFSFGTPVVTSNLSAMPEVAGNAAVLVNPAESESIASGIREILEENKEKQRLRLQKMIIRLQVFSWEKVALQTKQVYAKAIQQHH